MAQITLNSTGVASNGALVLQSNGTTTAVTISTAQVATLEKDAVVNGLTVGRGAGSVSTNTAVGASALAANTTGGRNTALGNESLFSNTTGNNNLAVGGRDDGAWTPLYSNTTGSNNVAVGNAALSRNTTASNNTAVGYQAGYSNTTGYSNAFFGRLAGYSTTTAYGSTFLGFEAGYSNTTGVNNTFVGSGSGYLMTTGSKNTILGSYSGNQGGLDIRTASNYIVLSDGDGNPRGIFDSSGNLLVGIQTSQGAKINSDAGSASAYWGRTSATGAAVGVFWNSATSGDNQFALFYSDGGPSLRGSITYNRGAGLVAYNVSSDYRAKDIIGPVTDSGALIDSVPVYMGKMKGATQERPMFIAHEVPAYAHTGEKDAVDKDGNPVYQQMDASALVPVMWAELQSLRQRLAAAGI